MKRLSWMTGFYCITGIFAKEDKYAAHKPFTRSCMKSVSPLVWRVPILIWAVFVTSWSIVFFWGPRDMFFIYMTHWGLLFIILETLFGIIVTLKKPCDEMSDATFGLPWYVKTYWLLYNITIPVAFLITVFYWGILKSSGKIMNYAPNPVLDVMLHGVNSIVMFVELACSAHPSRLMHIMQPLYFAGLYMLFNIIYYFAGGQDPWGNSFIYPVMDWSKPEQTMVVVSLTGVTLAILHLIVVGIASVRDYITRKRINDTAGIYNGGFGP